MALTQAQLDWIEDGKLIIPYITVYDGANTLATIDGANDIVDGSMSFDRNASSGTGFAAGYVEAAEVSFTLFNDTNQFDGITFEGKEISIVLDIAGTNVPYGRYIIDTKPILGRTIEIRALDYVVKLSKPCPVDVSGKTIGTALNDVLTSCGITQYPSTFTNSDKVLGAYDDLDDATSHEMVQWLVALTGGIGYMTPEATPRFRIAELDELQTPIQLPQHVVLAETNTGIDEVFSGVVMPIGDADYLVGDETGSVMGFESNPLMTLDMNYQAILNGIGGKVIGAHVTSAPSLSLLGQPFLMPLDKITFRDEFNAPVTTYVLTHTFKLNNGSDITSDWALRATDGYASMSPISPAQRVAIRQAAQQVIQRTQSEFETSMLNLNEQMANSLGYYVTTIEQPDGSKITYTHDQPVLADSSYISYQSASGFAFTNDGWNGGSPTWTYGITSDGSLVMRLISTVGLNAEWIKLSNSTKNIKEYVDDEISTHDSDLTAHGIKFTEITQTVNGLGEAVGTHTTNISELTATSLQLSQISDNVLQRSSLLTAQGLYTGTVTADQVVAGILSSLSGKAWFDLEKPEIVMESADGQMTWKASPERPLELLDGEGNFAGGAAFIGNKVALVSSILTNMLNPETWVNVGEMEDSMVGGSTDGLSLHHSPIDDSGGVFEILPYGSASDRRMVIRALPREGSGLHSSAIYFYATANENHPTALMNVMGNLGALNIWSQETPSNGNWAQVNVQDASVDLSVNGSSKKAEINVGDKQTSTHQGVGADVNGPYRIKNGTKTYFSDEGGESITISQIMDTNGKVRFAISPTGTTHFYDAIGVTRLALYADGRTVIRDHEGKIRYETLINGTTYIKDANQVTRMEVNANGSFRIRDGDGNTRFYQTADGGNFIYNDTGIVTFYQDSTSMTLQAPVTGGSRIQLTATGATKTVNGVTSNL